MIATIEVDKLLARTKRIQDPLVKLLEPWPQDTYISTTWSVAAYRKMFEKFHYADPCNIKETYPDLWDFATRLVLDEYSYMEKSVIISPLQTDKNMDSTPAFPKFLLYKTEKEFIEANGWKDYIDLWNTPVEELKHPLWWTFLKNEVLKKKKVYDDDIRMIMCTDPTFTRYGAAFEQHQNTLMKEHTEEKQAQTGWTPFYGGLDMRLKRLSMNKDTFVELDWTRYDGTIPPEVFKHIKELRWFLHHPDYKTEANKKRYDWYVKNLIYKPALLPTGEVAIIPKGNPSGQISTTTDNNMVNTFLTAFEMAWMYKKTWGRVPTLEEYRLNVDSICYGDDRVLAYNSSFCVYNPEEIPGFYKSVFGMWVKPENIKKQSTLDGLSFCGMTFVKHEGKYYGTPNVDKILSTIEYPVRRLPNIESLWGKLVSLRILLEFADKNARDYVERQLHRVKEYAQGEGITLPEVPDSFYRDIWVGP